MKKLHPIIGYMSNGIYRGGYHNNLWNGIQETTRANGARLVCFLGVSLDQSTLYRNEYQRNQVFDLISEENIDGLILSSATLISSNGYVEIDKVCDRLSHLPMVSIGLPLKNYPYLGVDNHNGEKALVDHLIEVHACRKIAFVRGPEDHQDAEDRFQAYQDSLAQHGIALDPDLIVRGDYTRSSGADAASHLLNELRQPFDALVAANDNMALGFIAALQDRGLQVPYDVAVVGFDDIPDAKIFSPSLTTVRQPIYELGQRAVERLLQELRGDNDRGNEILSTPLAIRDSCGCSSFRSPVPISINTPPAAISTGETVSDKTLIEEMVDALDCPPSQRLQVMRRARLLKEALEKTLTNSQQGINHSDELAKVMNSNMQKGPLLPWHHAISIFSQRWSEASVNHPLVRSEAKTWQGIWQIASEIAWFSQSTQRLRDLYFEEEKSENIRGVSQALVTSFDLSGLMDTAWRQLPKLGIKGCWISLYEVAGDGRQQVRIKLAYDQNGRIDLPSAGQVYPVSWLLPKEIINMDRSFEIIVNSLYFGETFFGLAIFEMDEPDQQIIDMVTTQISTALQGTKVINELQLIQSEFRQQANTDPLTGIYNRRMLYTLAEPAFDLARRHNLPLSTAMIDLDNFKHVNDRYGHAVGDYVLRAMSEFVQAQIRGTDLFGRYGGEEFVIILPETAQEGAFFLVERIRSSIENHLFEIGSVQVPLTISAGVSTLLPGQDLLLDNLINRADRALYAAKAAGKNRVAAA